MEATLFMEATHTPHLTEQGKNQSIQFPKSESLILSKIELQLLVEEKHMFWFPKSDSLIFIG
jgi:hypothetical protein